MTETPPGTVPDRTETGTLRQAERRQEDEAYVPVIIKRTDEARRHPDDILLKAIAEGSEQLKRPPLSLALSALAAGLILGFTAMAVAVIITVTAPLDQPAIERVLVAAVYPLGFVLCLMSGSELFTEHTATAVYPVLDKQIGLARLLRLWLIVGLGNLVGAAVSAALLWGADPLVGAGRVDLLVHGVARQHG